MLSDTELYADADPALAPFIFSYMGSARALMAGEEKNLGYLRDAFLILDHAVDHWGDSSSVPRFLRGSVAESLPPVFRKKNVARQDFHRMVELDAANPEFATDKTMSFVHYAIAKLDPKASKADGHLDEALALDPGGIGARDMVVKLRADAK